MKKFGFTLVELIVVISVVVILSLISVPIYKDYTIKAKVAEGYAALGAIRSAQENYFAEYGMFYAVYGGAYTVYDPVLNVNLIANKYYTAFIGAKNGDLKNALGFDFCCTVAMHTWPVTGIRLYYNITEGKTYKELP